jgi:hypothetical protein
MIKEHLHTTRVGKTEIVFMYLDDISPFTERPSCNEAGNEENEIIPKRIPANDLFSLFTANVIKERVIFTR